MQSKVDQINKQITKKLLGDSVDTNIFKALNKVEIALKNNQSDSTNIVSS